MTDNTVRIFDTTLRDGEQSPGATMTSTEKLEVARALSRLGVDIIEAGFPAASPDDLRAVRQIAQAVGQQVEAGSKRSAPPIICGLARAAKGDLDKAWEALEPAAHPRIHTFLATSPIHREYKLRMTKAEVLKRTSEMVAYARSLCADIEFSAEDAGRTEMPFLYEVLAAAIEAGATTLNIPDTVGYTLPHEYGARIQAIRDNVPGIEKCIISVHCHNDLGLATANTLAGIQSGARQAEVTLNGIGERAGNTALEEVVMALATRAPMFGLSTNIDTTLLSRSSRLVSQVTGLVVQPNKAIVGANAFAHEAGIHQDGMLKHQETYEIMRPETVGAGQTRLVLGKHSGRAAFASRLSELGYDLDEDAFRLAFAGFKRLADRKKTITDADMEALVHSEIYEPRDMWSLVDLQVMAGTMGMPTATVRLKGPDGTIQVDAAVGSGPVDSAFKAVDAIVGASLGPSREVDAELMEYTVSSVTEGIDAMGEVTCRVRDRSQTIRRLNPQSNTTRNVMVHGHGADTDIIVASVKAYLAAINRLLTAREAAALRLVKGASA